ncbi:AAA family ATPase [Streptosporangium saharense]|uniref:Putative ATPase n=1 Tax=Streptosporangium saharense TaxID=1706840 RepID=A0A7W7VL07_9ACTN|nr:ATP-binding protein [Streptosporangium saharense]MBB4913919.1 putative ATPase [Streptosporangium saharense]
MKSRLAELRLTEFKTFRDAVLPLGPMTTLIGRNSGGKSNALDGLEVLSRLAEGGDIVDALDSRRGDEGALRGGIEGCPPHGSDQFQLGCDVIAVGQADEGYVHLRFDVTILVRPEPVIVSERLTGRSGNDDFHDLLRSTETDPRSGTVDATWYNGRRGQAPGVPFRSDRLLISQLPLRLAGETEAERRVVTAVEDVLETLRGVFHLDPVPHLMRQYIPSRDVRLRRTAENLSAVVGRMADDDPERFRQLVSHVRGLVDHEVTGIEVIRSPLNDVMLALREDGALTPAREMSDGLLRFTAIATSLLRQGRTRETVSPTLVIEELENGLHPSQASQILDLVRQATREDTAQVIFTTHSPALLSALEPEEHGNVVVCTRDRTTGLSQLRKLPDMDGYPTLMAQGDLGTVITSGLLEQAPVRSRDFTAFDRLMGID